MGSDAPAQPSPQVTAAEQLNLNKKTSAFEAAQNRYNMFNPFGSVTWKNLGTADKPRWQQNTTLSAPQQRLYNTQLSTQNQAATGANRMMPGINSMLSRGGYVNEEGGNNIGIDQIGALQKQAISGGDLATRQRVENALMARMNPSLKQDEEALRARLANQGLQYGSEAYGNAMRDQSQRVNDARFAAIAQGGEEMQRSQQMSLAARNQQLNEINALQQAYQNRQSMNTAKQQNIAASRNQRLAELAAMLQSQGTINMPTYAGAQNVSTGGTPDLGALVNAANNRQIAANNANTATQNQALSSLGQLGSAWLAKK